MIINLNILTSQLRASKNIPSLISGLIPTIGTGPPFYYHKGGFCHYNRRRKEALAGPAPAGGGSGPKPGQGAKGKDTQTDSGRCNSGEGAAGNTEHGANGIGGILITKNTAEHLNCAKVSGKLEAFFFSRRAHLLTTLRAVVFPAETVRSARRMRLLREPMDNATALRDCCHCPRRMQPFPAWKQLQSCLRKPATGSFAAEMDSAPALSIFSFAKEKQKNRG